MSGILGEREYRTTDNERFLVSGGKVKLWNDEDGDFGGFDGGLDLDTCKKTLEYLQTLYRTLNDYEQTSLARKLDAGRVSKEDARTRFNQSTKILERVANQQKKDEMAFNVADFDLARTADKMNTLKMDRTRHLEKVRQKLRELNIFMESIANNSHERPVDFPEWFYMWNGYLERLNLSAIKDASEVGHPRTSEERQLQIRGLDHANNFLKKFEEPVTHTNFVYSPFTTTRAIRAADL